MGVRAIMDKYSLSYEDIDIVNVPENYAEMVAKSGQNLSPCVEIDGVMLADVSGDEVEAYMILIASFNKTTLPPQSPQTQTARAKPEQKPQTQENQYASSNPQKNQFTTRPDSIGPFFVPVYKPS